MMSESTSFGIGLRGEIADVIESYFSPLGWISDKFSKWARMIGSERRTVQAKEDGLQHEASLLRAELAQAQAFAGETFGELEAKREQYRRLKQQNEALEKKLKLLRVDKIEHQQDMTMDVAPISVPQTPRLFPHFSKWHPEVQSRDLALALDHELKPPLDLLKQCIYAIPLSGAAPERLLLPFEAPRLCVEHICNVLESWRFLSSITDLHPKPVDIADFLRVTSDDLMKVCDGPRPRIAFDFQDGLPLAMVDESLFAFSLKSIFSAFMSTRRRDLIPDIRVASHSGGESSTITMTLECRLHDAVSHYWVANADSFMSTEEILANSSGLLLVKHFLKHLDIKLAAKSVGSIWLVSLTIPAWHAPAAGDESGTSSFRLGTGSRPDAFSP